MGNSDLLDITKATIKSVGRLNLFPFSSPYFFETSGSAKLQANSEFMKMAHWKISVLLLISVVSCGLFKLIQENGNLLHTFCSSFHLYGFVLVALSVYCHFEWSKEFALLFSQLYQRAACHGNNAKRNVFWIDQGTRFISNNYASLAFLFGIFCGVKPTSDWKVLPEFVRSFISSCIPDFGVKLFSIWYNFTAWKIYGNVSIINVNLIIMILTFAFVEALKSIERKRNIAQNPYDFFSNVQRFREIQLLISLYNDITSIYVMPAYIFIGSSGFFFSLYALVFGFDELDIGTITIFSSGIAVSGAEIVFCFNWAKKINSNSKLMRKHVFPVSGMGLGWTSHKREMGKKYSKSFPELRIYFGNNFFERVTPLLMLDFSINQTLNLILMGK